MKSYQEVIFIGLSGPTHHYGGLSPDNKASDQNRGNKSNPKQAALQVIALARYLYSLGLTVALLPPQLRPYLKSLEELGLEADTAPIDLLEKNSSSSFMWAANAATVTPLLDSANSKLHITVANLHTNMHRRIEAQSTYNTLKQLFSSVPDVITHPPLEFSQGFLDEGAANHMRLSPSHSDAGLNVFVYGKRQNLQASQALAKNHHIPTANTLFLEQNPEVIAKGVFHNDVIAVSNENLLLVHEQAYSNIIEDIRKIEQSYNALHPQNKLQLLVIKNDDLTVDEAVGSYFFNSQIVTMPNGKMSVIAPQELKILYGGKAAKLMEKIGNNVFENVEYLDLKQSMKNGGGPACLRLRMVMRSDQITALQNNTGVVVNNTMLAELEKLIEKFYTEELYPEDLRSPDLYENGQKLLAELTKLWRINLQ